MSFELWGKLPTRFLRRGFSSFDKLDRAVKQLIIELAEEQGFRCALCSEDRNLVIEHEHEPGQKAPLTIYNIRGLVCQRCNQALKGCDMDECGHVTNWEHGYPYLASQDYEEYKYRFERRVEPLIDAAHIQRVGCRNPEHRKFVLWLLDRRYEEHRFPWQQRSKEAWNGKIETPQQLFQVLAACIKFVSDQLESDPNFEPPEDFWKMMIRVHPLIEEAKAISKRVATEGADSITQVEN